MAVDFAKLEQMKELQAQLEACKAEASADLADLVRELEKAIEGWGVHEVIPRLNFILSPLGYEADYAGVFRKEVQREILRRINTAPNHVAELSTETLEKISNVPDCNCRAEDVRKTLRHMTAEGIVSTHNPEGKKGRNSHYCLTPVAPAPDKPVDPSTIKGGKPKQ